MSDAAQIALISSAATIVVALLGFGSNLWATLSERSSRQAESQANSRTRERERLEESDRWYEHTLFDRRIAALHQANSWMRRVAHMVAQYWVDESDENLQALRQEVHDSEEWLANNLIYLYGDFPETKAIGAFFGLVSMFPEKKNSPTYFTAHEKASKELKEIATNLTNRKQDGT